MDLEGDYDKNKALILDYISNDGKSKELILQFQGWEEKNLW